ncbi:unnamed protein product, partial [Phaeothamnion confervicola]
SARGVYARRLLQHALPPMALVQPETEIAARSIELPHKSLGDGYIGVLSEVLSSLPQVDAVVLRDNRLTDVGVQRVVDAICNRVQTAGAAGIRVLDLSQNKLDGVAAVSLCAFLARPGCSLEQLLLSSADMDDWETQVSRRAGADRFCFVLTLSEN